MSSTRIAIIQFESSADVVFHDLATTDFSVTTTNRPSTSLSPSPCRDRRRSARRCSTALWCECSTAPYEADGDSRFTTVVYIDTRDDIIWKYRKTHSPVLGEMSGQKGAEEGFYFSAGDTGFVVPGRSPARGVDDVLRQELSGRRTQLCTARSTPIFVPTASYRESSIRDMWRLELQTLAFQNSIYVVGVNKACAVGKPPGRMR